MPASGIGSWPGLDPMEAARVAFGELVPPNIPYLPELPERGPGADMIGRGAALLVDLPVDLQPSGWRLVDHPGADLGRARAWLRQDLDVLAEVADGYAGPLKIQVVGPWTLAASLQLPRLELAAADPGACRDLVASLAEGVAQHAAEIGKLVPGAHLTVQVDEPSLPAVLRGLLPRASGYGRLRAVAEPVVVDGLQSVVTAAKAGGARAVVVHCCASGPPVPVLARTGADALALDVGQLGSAHWEAVAGAVESGARLWAGLPTGSAPGAGRGSAGEAADSIRRPWRSLGLPSAGLADVVVTPACGLAGRSASQARTALRLAREAAAVLAEHSSE